MTFTSSVFLLLFFPITFLVYYNPLVKSRSFRNGFLLIASLLFYAWGEPVYVFLMILSIIITYVLGRLINYTIYSSNSNKISKLLFCIGILYHLGVLFSFKYLVFFIEQVSLLTHIHFKTSNLPLPIGISFYTFQMISYLADVYNQKNSVQKNFISLGLYLALFPQLIAGPIIQYTSISHEIDNREENIDNICQGLARFVIGLSKKALLADYLGEFVDVIFAFLSTNHSISFVTAWIGAIAYSLEIYLDFSGYSDMAIGIGKCFGFHINENFNYPYIATSINDFWKRWHISLTSWFRNYVYIPLGGNRVSVAKHILNICLVWLLTGMWHGANWTFLIWGIIYCFLQLAEKYIYNVSRWPKPIGRIYTLFFVTINWVIFRSNSISEAFIYIKSLFGTFGFTDNYSFFFIKNVYVLFLISILVSIPCKQILTQLINKTYIYNNFISIFNKTSIIHIVQGFILSILLLLVIIKAIAGGYSPFIYFNF